MSKTRDAMEYLRFTLTEPPSTSLRAATFPAEEGEENNPIHLAQWRRPPPGNPSPEQPGTWVTVLTGDMGNMFQFLFMLH